MRNKYRINSASARNSQVNTQIPNYSHLPDNGINGLKSAREKKRYNNNKKRLLTAGGAEDLSPNFSFTRAARDIDAIFLIGSSSSPLSRPSSLPLAASRPKMSCSPSPSMSSSEPSSASALTGAMLKSFPEDSASANAAET